MRVERNFKGRLHNKQIVGSDENYLMVAIDGEGLLKCEALRRMRENPVRKSDNGKAPWTFLRGAFAWKCSFMRS